MKDLINQYKEFVEANKNIILNFTSIPEDTPIPELTINNNYVLVDCLAKVFEEDKSKYLPAYITRKVSGFLSNISKNIQSFVTDPQNGLHFKNIIQEMDELYACCLQYGFIPFGFDSKESQNILNQIQVYKDDIIQTASEVRKNITQKNKGIEKHIDAVSKKIESAEASLTSTVQEIIDDYKTKAEKQLKDAAEVVGKINSLQEEIDKSKKTIGLEQTAITGLKEEISKTKETLSKELQQIQGEHQTILTQASTTTTLFADINKRNEDSAKLLANIQGKDKEITVFYQTMEKYKQDILAFQKGINENYTKLLESTENSTNSFYEETKQIIEKNKSQQNEIAEHLTKAVGASLFSAFGKRKLWLFWSRIIWLVVLAGSISGVCLLVWLLAGSGSANVVFFIRLSVMVPLAFLIWFATMQYSKERHSEEEYAFKSTISISLEPYRDLLKKMREDKATETDFVQKLMEEVFTNPVTHIYKDHSDAKGILERKQEIVEIIKEIGNFVEKIKTLEDFIANKTNCVSLLGKLSCVLLSSQTKI